MADREVLLEHLCRTGWSGIPVLSPSPRRGQMVEHCRGRRLSRGQTQRSEWPSRPPARDFCVKRSLRGVAVHGQRWASPVRLDSQAWDQGRLAA